MRSWLRWPVLVRPLVCPRTGGVRPVPTHRSVCVCVHAPVCLCGHGARPARPLSPPSPPPPLALREGGVVGVEGGPAP